MGPTNLDTILGLLFDHTGWPDYPSSHSLSEFTRLLSLVSPSDRPKEVLDTIIRSGKNTDLLCWILSWLQYSYHPMSFNELAVAVECYRSTNTNTRDIPAQVISPTETREQLRSWLHMLTGSRDDQATIRQDIMALFVGNTDTASYIWNEVN